MSDLRKGSGVAPWERPMDRREFLRLMVGGAAMAGAPLLAGCGGGGGGGAQGQNGGPSMPAAQRTAALDAVSAQANSLDLRDRATANQQMLQYLKTRPELKSLGMAADGTVYGAFTDGVGYRFINDMHPDSETAAVLAASRSASRAPTDSLPKTAGVYCLDGLGTYITAPCDRVREMLFANGYTDGIGAPRKATVEALRNVKGAGALLLAMHGGEGDSTDGGPGGFCLATCTKVTPATEQDPLIQADIADGSLIYVHIILDSYLGGLFNGKVETTYGITHKFIKKYMTMAENSFVYLLVCSGDDLLVKMAFFDVKASVFGGWSMPVRAVDGVKNTLYVFDRLLGANQQQPVEDPAQRPFDYKSVYVDMKTKGLDVSVLSGTTSRFAFSPNPRSDEFGTLAPTIMQMDVDEVNDRLILRGIFGHDKGTVKVNDATELTIDTWAPGLIKCVLPPNGAGSCGNVQVIVRNHKSNVRQITQWRIPLRYMWTDAARDGLKVVANPTLRFRCDVGSYRTEAGETPIKPARTALAARDSSALFSASGTWSGGGVTSTWSGSHLFEVAEYPHGTPGSLVTRLKIDTEGKKVLLGLALAHPTGKYLTEVDTSPGGSVTLPFGVSFSTLDGAQSFPDPLNSPVPALLVEALQVGLDDDFTIAPRNYSGLAGMVHVSWDAVTPDYPPDPQGARSVPRRA